MKSIFHAVLAVCAVAPQLGHVPVAQASESSVRTPVVVFPAFHFTKLRVTVSDQTVAPDCPSSGSFTDWFLNDSTDTTFSQVCQDKLLTLEYNDCAAIPMANRFSNPNGVRVDIIDYGKTSSAPFYETLYSFLEANGYHRDQDIRVAGYDARLTPDIGDFLSRSVALIEQTYRDNGNRPVHLIGHSNGPLYAQYLLTHTSAAWKKKYIHGFTPLAGNWPGQGLIYPVYLTGLNVVNFGFPTTFDNALSSALMYQAAPSSYMSSSDPAIFGDREVVFSTIAGNRSYTPKDNLTFFRDAGLPRARALAAFYIGFVKFADPAHFPNVDVYAEKGSGLDTIVGAQLPDLSTGQVIDGSTVFYSRNGDSNQEDITNDSIKVWGQMKCYHFELNDNAGIGHFDLPSNPDVLQRLLMHLDRQRSSCP